MNRDRPNASQCQNPTAILAPAPARAASQPPNPVTRAGAWCAVVDCRPSLLSGSTVQYYPCISSVAVRACVSPPSLTPLPGGFPKINNVNGQGRAHWLVRWLVRWRAGAGRGPTRRSPRRDDRLTDLAIRPPKHIASHTDRVPTGRGLANSETTLGTHDGTRGPKDELKP